jgi:phospholipid transport system substrate-binding protein
MTRTKKLASLLATIAISIALLSFAAVPSAEAQTSPARASAFVQELSGRAIALLAHYDDAVPTQLNGQFDDLIKRGFDLEAIGRFALGRAWQRATAQQQRDYQAVFAAWAIKTYTRRLTANKGGRLDVIDGKPFAETDALVRTKITLAGGMQVDADLRVRETEGRMKIVDVIMEGVSLAVTQRAEFGAVIEHQGLDGLIADLRGKVQDLDMAQEQLVGIPTEMRAVR